MRLTAKSGRLLGHGMVAVTCAILIWLIIDVLYAQRGYSAPVPEIRCYDHDCAAPPQFLFRTMAEDGQPRDLAAYVRVDNFKIPEAFRPRIAARREEFETILNGSEEEAVLLHPNMAAHYRSQVAALAEALTAEEHRAEAAEIIRSLVDRITLTPNAAGKLEIDLFGDLAVILSLAANTERLLNASDPSVQQVKMVAGARYGTYLTAPKRISLKRAAWIQ